MTPATPGLPLPPKPEAAVWRSAAAGPALPRRRVLTAIWRGFRGLCSNCGKGKLFRRFLKVVDACPACGEEFHHHRADDAPPYITMLVVGHIVVPTVLAVETVTHLSSATQIAIWLPVTFLMTVLLLQPVKGAVVGLQWALRMHGFHPDGDEADPITPR